MRRMRRFSFSHFFVAQVVSARRDEVDRRAVTGTWGGNLQSMSGSGGVHAGGARSGPGSQASLEYSDFKLAPKSETGFAGLSNQGATCYLNSFIQSLYMTPEFRKAVFNWRLPASKYDMHPRARASAPCCTLGH